MEKDILQLKLDMGDVKKDMSYVKKGHEDMKKSVEKGFKDLGEKIDDLDSKFSAKWVEKIMVWTARIIGLTLLGGLITVIWKAAVFFIG